MSSILLDIRQTLVPDQSGKDGPLPPLLLCLTLVTGLVDAFSYLALGHILVANMTGNVVFLGFALAGAPGFFPGVRRTDGATARLPPLLELGQELLGHGLVLG